MQQPDIRVYFLKYGLAYAGLNRQGKLVKVNRKTAFRDTPFREFIKHSDSIIIHRREYNRDIFEIRTENYQLRKYCEYETIDDLQSRLIVTYSALSNYQKIISIKHNRQRGERFVHDHILKIEDNKLEETCEYRSKSCYTQVIAGEVYTIMSVFYWPDKPLSNTPRRNRQLSTIKYPEYAYLYAMYIHMQIEGMV